MAVTHGGAWFAALPIAALTLSAILLHRNTVGAQLLTRAIWLGRFLVGLLYGVAPTDGLTYGAVALLLLAVALLGSWVPARRATRVDPLLCLRCE